MGLSGMRSGDHRVLGKAPWRRWCGGKGHRKGQGGWGQGGMRWEPPILYNSSSGCGEEAEREGAGGGLMEAEGSSERGARWHQAPGAVGPAVSLAERDI